MPPFGAGATGQDRAGTVVDAPGGAVDLMPDQRDQRARFWAAYRQHLHDADRAERTVTEYRRALYAFWDHAAKQPSRVNARDLFRFLNRDAVAGGNAKGAKLAEATRATYAHELAAAYRWFAAVRLVKRDPFAGLALPRHRLGPPRSLGMPAVGAILDHAAAQGWRVWLEVWLGFGAGLRVHEMALLRLENVHLGARPHLRLRGKGGDEWVEPLNRKVAAVLRLALAGRPASGPVLCHDADHSRPVSRKTVGHELNATIQQALAAAHRLDPEVPPTATAHQLRHTFATEILAGGRGTNERAVQYLLRQRDPKSVQRYTLAYRQDAWDAVDKLPVPDA